LAISQALVALFVARARSFAIAETPEVDPRQVIFVTPW
jgi:hypothetical protein